MKDDLFENTDNMTIDSLAQDFPVLTDEEKERIYAMSERKYNNDTNMNTDEKFDRKIEVTGVERYKRPKWRSASIAAAAALVLGAGSFGGYNIAQQFHDGNGEDELPTNVSEEMSQESTGAVDDSRAEEYRSTAESLVEAYEDFLCPFIMDELPEMEDHSLSEEDYNSMTEEEINEYYRKVEEEDSKYHDSIWFELRSGTPAEPWTEKSHGSWSYDYYSSGMKFSNTDEVRDKALSIMSQSCIDKMFPKLIGEDLTGYETDRIYDYDNEKYPDFGIFAMYNGKLYCCTYSYLSTLEVDYMIPASFYFYNRQDAPIDISDITDDSFTACVHYEFTSVPNKHDMTMKVVKNGENWIIDDIEPSDTNSDPQKEEIVDKMMNSIDYFDNISVKSAQAYFLHSAETNGIDGTNISFGKDYANNNDMTSYSFGFFSNEHDIESDPQALLDYARNYDFEGHEKMVENYSDGEKFYYWSPENEFGPGYHEWDYWVPKKDDPKLTLDNYLKIMSDGSPSLQGQRAMHCPNGSAEVFEALYDFSCWDITGDTTFDGRDCYIIDYTTPERKGVDQREYYTNQYSRMVIYVDKETGIPMCTMSYNENGSLESCDIYYDMHLNADAEPVPNIDMNQYDLSSFTYK